MKAAGTSAVVAADGQVLDLGNVQVTVFTQPGHTNGLSTVIINQPGWAYVSDNFCCNRADTADTTQYNGTKVMRGEFKRPSERRRLRSPQRAIQRESGQS